MSERKKLKKKYEQTREEAKLLRSAAEEEGSPFMFPVRCAVQFSRPFHPLPRGALFMLAVLGEGKFGISASHRYSRPPSLRPPSTSRARG